MGSDEEKAVDMLSRNRSIHQSCIEKFNGTLIKEIGDGILASFSLASEAVRCAIEIQKECKEQDIPLKIGIHEGEMIFSGSDVIGDGVNIASRLQEDAQEGCINISASVYRDIKNKADIQTKLIGDKSFKNVDEPIRVYELLLEVETEKQAGESMEQKKSKRKLPFYILAGLIVTIVILIIIWIFIPFNKNAEYEKSVAVRPFWNESTNQENEFFVNGMTEEIRNNLAKIADLRVLSRGSVEKYRDSNYTNKEIARELDVSYVLEGTVQRIGNQLMIHTQLILPETEDHIWEETYRKEISDIAVVFDIQSQIAQSVAKEIKAIITPQERQIIESVSTNNIHAYDLYLKGREFHSIDTRYKNTEKQQIENAIKMYNQAIELDPQFAPAYIWLGMAYFEKTLLFDFFKESYADTLKYFADKALSINPNLEEGYWLRGYFYYEKGNFEASIEQIKRAIDLNHNYPEAYQTLADNYRAKSDYINALINYEKARKLMIGASNYQRILYNIGTAYHDISFYEKAEAYYKELVNYNPNEGYFFLYILAHHNKEWDKFKAYGDHLCELDSGEYCHRFLFRWYLKNGDLVQAKKYYLIWREMALYKDFPDIYFAVFYGYILFNQNLVIEAQEIFDKQIEYSRESIRLKRFYATGSWGGMAHYNMAATYAILGDKEKTYQVLHEMENTAFSGWYTWQIQIDPMFENFWEDGEFKAIIDRQERKFTEIRAEVDQLEAEGLL
jgi:TolB-like protein